MLFVPTRSNMLLRGKNLQRSNLPLATTTKCRIWPKASVCEYKPLLLKVWSLNQQPFCPWELIRNADSQVPPQAHWIRICILMRSQEAFVHIQVQEVLL